MAATKIIPVLARAIRGSAIYFRLVLLALILPLSAQAATEVDTLRTEVEQLKLRLDSLEGSLEDEVQAKESASESQDRPQTPAITIGGALRYTYAWRNFEPNSDAKLGDVGLDLFRLNVDGQRDNFLVSAEYRFYPYMSTLHHGWFGYETDSGAQWQAGVSQVPFGLLPYASHNFWFGVPFYLGLADDYDSGIKFIDKGEAWDLQLAFYKNGELGNAASSNRYSYDPIIVSADNTAQNEEVNTFNARLAYTFGAGRECNHELGLSAQAGQLYNRQTQRHGSQWASALHLDSRCGRWNIQFEAGRYGYQPRNASGVSDNTVTLGAFAYPYAVASRGSFGVLNFAYNLPVAPDSVDLITCYNDFSVLGKDEASFNDSMVNTLGCAIGDGPLFTYIDLVAGHNMIFLGSGSLAGGGNNQWETRLNINVGYYW
ncbi:MAG: hypothetical protein HUJ29_08475 [Gammaproteobacteria bacterium]|nr:hypothetical protein [Gammaproteobacteria bacterium]